MAVGLKARSKYRAIKVKDDCIVFDSKREHAKYCELKLLWKAGEFLDLHVHPQFPIVWPGGSKICVVELDFTITEKDGSKRYLDVKGFDTALSKLKRKLVEAAHGITVEVIK